MSADRWSLCPQCIAENKVDEEEYDISDTEETLRQDWEIGTDEEGRFFVDYHCSCDICGLAFNYKFAKNIL